MRIWLGFLLAIIAVAAATGPDVGTAIPNFSLPDQNGNIRTLKSLMGPDGLMLVFFRSADW
jgi:peroxiredoxin